MTSAGTNPGASEVVPLSDGSLVLRALPYDHPDARWLVDELNAETEHRYRFDSSGRGEAPEQVAMWTVRPGQVTSPHGVFVAAYRDNHPVACGALRPLAPGADGRLRPALGDQPVPVGERDTAEVKRMYVVPGARGRGISRAVLDRLVYLATELGYRRVQLETGQRQPEAISLYERSGWQRVARYGQYAGDPLSVCFAKDLW